MAWLLLIIGSQGPLYWLAVPLILFFFVYEYKTDEPTGKQYRNRFLIAVGGCLADSLFSAFQLIRFSQDSHFIPIWLILMWILFALAFSSCYRWLHGKPALAIGFAAIFGPGAYWGATQLANVEILHPVTFTLFSSLFWGGLFAVIFINRSISQVLFSLTKSTQPDCQAQS